MWGAGQQLAGSKRTGDRRSAGTGQRPGERMNLECRIVVWGSTGSGEGEVRGSGIRV